MRLGIVGNTTKPHIPAVLIPFLSWLGEEGIDFVVSADLKQSIPLDSYRVVNSDKIGENIDFVISFGGDGTFLKTAQLVLLHGTPIIGVNLGGFGYLAEVGVEKLNERIHDLADGKFEIQSRMMLEARLSNDDTCFHALNDFVIDKGEFPRTILIQTSIDDEFLNTFHGDGLIIATSTGSTGYSLSAGGPIMEPCMNGIVVNPICPHMLANRPLVICNDRELRIITKSELGKALLTADGQRVHEIKSGDAVIIKQSSYRTKVVTFGDPSFFTLLRNKLQWRHKVESQNLNEAPDLE
jgi:NAD+ kinase